MTPATHPPGIEVEGVRLDYGDTAALADLSFRLEGGRIYGLLGRNGAGKSSLLSLVAAFRLPTAGSVRVGGQPVFEQPDVVAQICLIRETGDTVDGAEPVREALAFAARLRPTWDADYAERLVDRCAEARRAVREADEHGARAHGAARRERERARVVLVHVEVDAPASARVSALDGRLHERAPEAAHAAERIAARQQLKVPLRFTSSERFQSASFIPSTSPFTAMPALLTRMCSPPSAATISLNAASTAAASATSKRFVTAAPPAAARRRSPSRPARPVATTTSFCGTTRSTRTSASRCASSASVSSGSPTSPSASPA